MKILIGADLLLEALLNRDGLTAEAEKLWNFLESKPTRPELAEFYITDFALEKINLMTRTLAGVEAAEAINSTIRKLVSIYSVDRTIIEQARSLKLIDFESAIEVVCAFKMSAKAIVTHSSYFDIKERESMVSLSIWSVEKLVNEHKNICLRGKIEGKLVESSFGKEIGENDKRFKQLESERKSNVALDDKKQNELEEINDQLAQHIEQERQEFDTQFAELICRNSSDGRLVFAFTRRLLMQFRLKGTYSEAYVINEAYIRGIKKINEAYVINEAYIREIKKINKGNTIRKFSPWLRGTIYNIVRELSRGRIRDSSDEYNEEIDQQLQSSLTADENLNYELQLIKLAYEMLDANDKKLLNLKIIERHTWSEIREILIAQGGKVPRGKVPSISALRKRKERALANLRKLYHEVKESSNMSTID